MPRVEYFLIHAGPVFSPAAFYLFDECTGTILFRPFLRYLIRRAVPTSRLRPQVALAGVRLSFRFWISGPVPALPLAATMTYDGPHWHGSVRTPQRTNAEVIVPVDGQ